MSHLNVSACSCANLSESGMHQESSTPYHTVVIIMMGRRKNSQFYDTFVLECAISV